MVRYHSLVIDAESLPKELIPIAWTSSIGTHSFLETHSSSALPYELEHEITVDDFYNDLSAAIQDVSLQSSNHSGNMLRRKVVMGIKHSTRPHYGLQVGY